MVEILIPLGFFATVFGIVYIAVTARNKERMALIEKGQDASIFRNENRLHGRYAALKYGILAIGVGIGLIVANILDINRVMDDDVVYFSMILLFGGLSLLVYYVLMKRIKPEENEN